MIDELFDDSRTRDINPFSSPQPGKEFNLGLVGLSLQARQSILQLNHQIYAPVFGVTIFPGLVPDDLREVATVITEIAGFAPAGFEQQGSRHTGRN
uniref:Uncharacterized protein n=1 Tax=Pseudomonas fluorescens (strain SBW25) TaxID=216595 RepID=A4V704_PSEFS|nr:hypothetical protein pQBR0283 [Pseudomonas fluorescens SBW25]